MLVSRRLPHNIPIIPIITPNVDPQSNICDECGQIFKNTKGKLIHFTRMHTNKHNQDQTPVGFSKCGDIRCNTCKKGTFGDTINITATKKVFNIRQRITCKTPNIIYCLTCKKCQAQEIGETENAIHIRQAGHLQDIKSNKPGIPYVKHYQQCGIVNYTVTVVEKLRSHDIMIRKERENFYKKLFDVQMG